MEEITDANNPLHGRFAKMLKLRPLDYLEASHFYPSYSPEDKLAFYSVFGGIPFYLSLIDMSKSFHENIIDILLSHQASFIKNEINGSFAKRTRKSGLPRNDFLSYFERSFPLLRHQIKGRDSFPPAAYQHPEAAR